jgi:FkbM family methyltransferase
MLLARLLEPFPLAFNMLEVGALPLDNTPERFHQLLEVFPSSRVSALEIDPALCEKLNREARAGIRFYPCALGRSDERRTLYETAHPMCSSLYEPDERYIALFNNLSVMKLKQRTEVSTLSLDTFAHRFGLAPFDFVKMDIQGAELDVLQGGEAALDRVLAIVCEVEFVPLYKDQPLYGDVDAHLRRHGMMLHRFLGFGGRVAKPLALHGSVNYPVQYLWSDALFVRDLFDLEGLHDERLLKLAVLLDLYDSKDLALYVLRLYDSFLGTRLSTEYAAILKATGVWTEKSVS